VVGFCEHGNEPSVSIKKVGYLLIAECNRFSNNVLHHGVSSSSSSSSSSSR
jgi:hypothetical protein